jgi:hypothetical protein
LGRGAGAGAHRMLRQGEGPSRARREAGVRADPGGRPRHARGAGDLGGRKPGGHLRGGRPGGARPGPGEGCGRRAQRAGEGPVHLERVRRQPRHRILRGAKAAEVSAGSGKPGLVAGLRAVLQGLQGGDAGRLRATVGLAPGALPPRVQSHEARLLPRRGVGRAILPRDDLRRALRARAGGGQPADHPERDLVQLGPPVRHDHPSRGRFRLRLRGRVAPGPHAALRAGHPGGEGDHPAQSRGGAGPVPADDVRADRRRPSRAPPVAGRRLLRLVPARGRAGRRTSTWAMAGSSTTWAPSP